MMTEDTQNENAMLIALDGSRPSQVAAALAVQIARQACWSVRGLFVVDERLVVEPDANLEKELGYHPGNVLTSDERADLLRKKGDAALRWLEEQGQTEHVAVDANLMFGGLPDLIINQAQQARLLALGRHGYAHPHNLGHHFRAITHAMPTSLLIGGEEMRPIQRLLLACDERLSDEMLAWASRFQRLWEAQLWVLIVAENETASQNMEAQIAASGLSNVELIRRSEDTAVAILTISRAQNIDLILMGNQRNNALHDWLSGSSLNEVLRNSPLPLFVMDTA